MNLSPCPLSVHPSPSLRTGSERVVVSRWETRRGVVIVSMVLGAAFAGLVCELARSVGGGLTPKVVIDADNGRLRARAEASIKPQRYLFVRRVALVLEAEVVHKLGHDLRRADEVAGGAPADLDGVLGGRLEPEVLVEGGDAPDV